MNNMMKILSRVVLIAAFGILFSFMSKTEVKAVDPDCTASITAPAELVKGQDYDIQIIFTFNCEITAENRGSTNHMTSVGYADGLPVTVGGTTENGNIVTHTESVHVPLDTTLTSFYFYGRFGSTEKARVTIPIVAPPTYTITFDANGGTVSPTSGTTDASGKLSSLPTPQWTGHDFSGWFTTASGDTQVTTNTVFTGNDTIYAHWSDSNTVNVNVTFKVKNGSWNDGTRTNKTKNLWRYENQDLALQLTAADIPGVGNNPDSGYRAGSWDVEPPIGTNLSNESRNLTYTYTYAGSGSSGSKKSDDSDHHEESSSPEKPSWTPAQAAATIAAEKAAKQQAAGTQQAAVQTLLRTLATTNPTDGVGEARKVIVLDMTKVDILDPATVNLLTLNSKFEYYIKISDVGGLTTTVKIPANFNYRPFIKADGTMNIHEVLWSIVKSRIKKATPKGSLYMIR